MQLSGFPSPIFPLKYNAEKMKEHLLWQQTVV